MPRCWRLSLTTRAQRTIESRNQSPILQMRNLNNWIKSVLLNLVRRQENAVVCFLERTCLQYIKRGHRVFDLCCGKGGDLQKFTRMGVSLVFGAGFFFFFFVLLCIGSLITLHKKKQTLPMGPSRRRDRATRARSSETIRRRGRWRVSLSWPIAARSTWPKKDSFRLVCCLTLSAASLPSTTALRARQRRE